MRFLWPFPVSIVLSFDEEILKIKVISDTTTNSTQQKNIRKKKHPKVLGRRNHVQCHVANL